MGIVRNQTNQEGQKMTVEKRKSKIKSKTNPNGVILYEGPSPVDGSPIVAIATGLTKASANSKTGRVIQTWIMRSDLDPWDAVKSGKDLSVCGDCIHRRTWSEVEQKWVHSCYVDVPRAPKAIFNCFKRGGYLTLAEYPKAVRIILRNILRLGSYGDPAMIPIEVWAALIGPNSPLGYTHQWESTLFDIDPRFKLLLMASVESGIERQRAESKGWRVFQGVVRGSEPPKGLKQCPSDPTISEDKQVGCDVCQACDGKFSEITGRRKPRTGRFIYLHGLVGSRLKILNAA